MKPKFLAALARAAQEKYWQDGVLLRTLEAYDDLEAKGGALAVAEYLLKLESDLE